MTTAAGLRLMLGTLTVLPVRPPAPDRRTAAAAMTLAPVGGLVLAGLVAAPAALAADLAGPLLSAALSLVALALLTRALHLDGLADTADGLGSARTAPEALAVMRRPDVGPFGVATLVLTLVVQVAALAECFAAGRGAVALAVALVVSRAVLTLLATPGWPAARADGLGVVYAGTLPPAVAAAGVLAACVLAWGLAWGLSTPVAGVMPAPWVLAQPLALLPAWALARRCRRRLGGLTGDVYGACVEVAFTGSLVLAAVVG